MADVWSFDAGTDTFTYTMDGSGSGQASRSKTFSGLTAGGQYTFYQDVDPTASEVNAFLEIDGGATDVADTTGSQTLQVTGDADGSGNITLRFGVQNAESAPNAAGSDDLDYANQAAAEAAGWVVVPGPGTVTFDSGTAVGAFPTSIKITRPDSAGDCWVYKDFAVSNGATYIVKVWCTLTGPWFHPAGLRCVSGANSGNSFANGGQSDTHESVTITADGTTLRVYFTNPRSSLFGSSASLYVAGLTIDGLTGGGATVDFTKITYCSGTGVGDGGTGLGDGDEDTPPSDPIPDPPPGGYPAPPAGGARPFGLYRLPVEGLGYWNSTVKGITPTNTVNLVNAATTAGSLPRFRFGPEKDWFDASDTFQYSLWKVTVDRVYNDARCKAALDTAIAAGVLWAFDLMDEPNRVDRYNGAVPLATVERMFLYVKSLWPTARTVLRTSPTNGWFTRHINGLDTCWSEYHLKRGDVTTFRDREIAGAVAKGHTLILGIHYVNFDGIHLGSSVGRIITPSELRHYGGILASSTSSTVAGMDGWCYVDRLVAQPGWWDALKYVRDLFASHDP